LDLAAANFIQTEVELKKDKLWLSQIFNWYKDDFGGKKGLVKFLLQHLPEGSRRSMLIENGEKTRFLFSPYNWSLNI
jgi:hypothetical protein